MGNKNSTVTKINRINSKVIFDDIIIIWLNVNEHEKSVNNIKLLNKFQEIVDSVEIFNEMKIFEEYIENNINKNKIIFLILSGKFIDIIIPKIHDIISINSIYIYSQDKSQYELLSKKYLKLKGHLFKRFRELLSQIKQEIRCCQNDFIPMDILDNKLINDQFNKLQPNFMYSQLLKEILIKIKFDTNSRKDFINYCLFNSNLLNINQINIIYEFDNEYENHSSIWWYTRESFVYKMLNKALRTENIDILIKMGFFIKDLHKEIEYLYSLQEHSSMIVYRGQGITYNQFEQLCKCKNGLISFQCFLSTSRDKKISIKFARRAMEKPGLRGIIFQMNINSKMINLSNPYASLNKLSYFKNNEKEILFSTHTVFRIEDIQQIKNENNISIVFLNLINIQNDVQFEQLTNFIRKEIQLFSNPWESLAKLMLTMEEFDVANNIYENILQQTDSYDHKQIAGE